MHSLNRFPQSVGLPTLPGSSYHIDPIDYDGDGDLDLIIGARSQWMNENVKVLTAEEEEKIVSLETATRIADGGLPSR